MKEEMVEPYLVVVGEHLTTGLKFHLGARRLPDAKWVKKIINRKLLGVFCHLESLQIGRAHV